MSQTCSLTGTFFMSPGSGPRGCSAASWVIMARKRSTSNTVYVFLVYCWHKSHSKTEQQSCVQGLCFLVLSKTESLLKGKEDTNLRSTDRDNKHKFMRLLVHYGSLQDSKTLSTYSRSLSRSIRWSLKNSLFAVCEEVCSVCSVVRILGDFFKTRSQLPSLPRLLTDDWLIQLFQTFSKV